MSHINPLSVEQLSKIQDEFEADPRNNMAVNACSETDPFTICRSRKVVQNTQHTFSHKISVPEGKPVTNQKSSGRCWIFACLNVMRIPFMDHFKIEEFEFSQTYLFFWDKIERCHYWLHNIVETAKRGEGINGRLVSFLLQDPVNDGGQWDMLVNLIKKYGVVPKKCFPETFSSEASQHMNALLRTTLRSYAKELRELVEKKESDAKVQGVIDRQMMGIFKIVAICLGTPPKTIMFEYYNKSKAYNSIGPITPQKFYEEHVKPVFNVDDKVCLVTDPRPSNPFGALYTVDCLGNMVGGKTTRYNNQSPEILAKAIAKSIKYGEAVWFGCEVSKRFHNKLGIQDIDVYDFSLVFGTDAQVTMSKANRLIYGDSCMTHAMVFTAVHQPDENRLPTKYRVENSWGEDKGEKGYLILTDKWFDEFVFEAVCDKKYLSKEVLDVFDTEPIVLPAWDPMGTLAK